MDQNICKFVPVQKGAEVRVLNYVYETDPAVMEKHRIQSYGALCLTAHGEGTLHTDAGHFPLREGTLFLTFPMQQFYIEQRRELQYLYITFIGQRILSVVERVGLTEQSAVRDGLGDLIPFWKSSLTDCVPGNIDLVAEAVLLYTLARLTPDTRADADTPDRPRTGAAEQLKEYADAHYADAHLTLASLAAHMSYNPKYLSDCFSHAFGIGFREYVQSLRIQRACELMQNGLSSSKEIAGLIGFSDPLYFSKVFTRVMGASPQRHIAALRQQSSGTDDP
ncbi:MAG: helix-turn-helix domain-containing protein [Eubacteriales bacterium]